MNSIPQEAATTFAFSSVFILLLCVRRKSVYHWVMEKAEKNPHLNVLQKGWILQKKNVNKVIE